MKVLAHNHIMCTIQNANTPFARSVQIAKQSTARRRRRLHAAVHLSATCCSVHLPHARMKCVKCVQIHILVLSPKLLSRFVLATSYRQVVRSTRPPLYVHTLYTMRMHVNITAPSKHFVRATAKPTRRTAQRSDTANSRAMGVAYK